MTDMLTTLFLDEKNVTEFFETRRMRRFGRRPKNGHFFGHDNKITIYYR